MKTETLPVARVSRKPGMPRRLKSPKKHRRWRPAWALRILIAAAIIAAASWYLLPLALDYVPGADAPTRTMVTTDDVNLRAGPGTMHGIVSVIQTGTEVAASPEQKHGFIRVSAQGERGWVSAAYLAAPGTDLVPRESAQAAESQPVAPVETVAAPQQTAPPEPTAAPIYQPIVAQSTQVQPEPQPGEKWIEVNRTNRTVTLYDGEIVVAQFNALVGKDLSADGYYSTALGTYHVHVKEKALVETPFAEGVFLTDFVGFDPVRSNGFHSPVRDASGNVVVTGGSTTLGCVRLSEADAIFLFDFATMGMRVEVRD